MRRMVKAGDTVRYEAFGKMVTGKVVSLRQSKTGRDLKKIMITPVNCFDVIVMFEHTWTRGMNVRGAANA